MKARILFIRANGRMERAVCDKESLGHALQDQLHSDKLKSIMLDGGGVMWLTDDPPTPGRIELVNTVASEVCHAHSGVQRRIIGDVALLFAEDFLEDVQ